MRAQYVYTKKQFIEQMSEIIKDDEVVLLSTIIQGQMKGATRKSLKSFSVGFTNDCFKSPETISDLLKSFLAGLIIMKKEYQTEEIKKFIKDSKEK